MLLKELKDKGLINPPSYTLTNTHYLTITGSTAYGAADTHSEKISDWDIYGVFIPPKEIVFPHLAGKVWGFDKYNYDQLKPWMKHHIFDASAKAGKGREYDFTLYNIVAFFKLLAENNPNVLDTLYTPSSCVLHTTDVGNILREKRGIFLHKGLWASFRGYAYSQIKKMKDVPKGSRLELFQKFGYDVKYAMHLVRLILECEQLLVDGDMDFSKNAEVLKSIRRGEWAEEKVIEWFNLKEKHLETLYNKTTLPSAPQYDRIRELLLNCLEMHYGNLGNAVTTPDRYLNALNDIRQIVDKCGI